jgi:hypothetical protein
VVFSGPFTTFPSFCGKMRLQKPISLNLAARACVFDHNLSAVVIWRGPISVFHSARRSLQEVVINVLERASSALHTATAADGTLFCKQLQYTYKLLAR